MNPNDPNQQQNPGQFMNPQGQNPGQGSALLQLLRLRAMGASPQMQNQNTQNPNAVAPAQPPQGQGNVMSSMPPAQPPQGAQPQQAAPQVQQPVQPEDNLQIAMGALGNYIKSHGEILKAKHGITK